MSYRARKLTLVISFVVVVVVVAVVVIAAAAVVVRQKVKARMPTAPWKRRSKKKAWRVGHAIRGY